jgi:8-oxo-dGTP diphosphatase
MDKPQHFKTAVSEKISHIDYFRIAISIDCVIFGYEKKELKVLLIKSDFKEFWECGHCWETLYSREDLESASYRVLKKSDWPG